MAVQMVAIREEEFKAFSHYIRANFGIHLKDEKKALVAGRLHSVLLGLNFTSLSQYMQYVTADKTGQAVSTMLDKITTNYTFFLREEEHFWYFRDTVLPYLARTVNSRDLRVWSAACSSGEEPYTLAMVIDEFFGRDKVEWDTRILATDISTNVLTEAQRGIYAREKLANLPSSWQQKYFRKYDAQNEILTDRIRGEVIFNRMNLVDSGFPFKRKLHVIFCRNVMIYFDGETKDRLVERMYDATESGGYLFIGHSEGLNREITRYRYVMPSVYRKE